MEFMVTGESCIPNDWVPSDVIAMVCFPSFKESAYSARIVAIGFWLACRPSVLPYLKIYFPSQLRDIKILIRHVAGFQWSDPFQIVIRQS